MTCKTVNGWVTGMLKPLLTMLISVLILTESLYSLSVSVQQTENAAESKAKTSVMAMNDIHMLPKFLTEAEAHKNQRKTSGPNRIH